MTSPTPEHIGATLRPQCRRSTGTFCSLRCRSRLALRVAVLAISFLLIRPNGLAARESPIGVLLAAGDIATCSDDPIRSGRATADLVEREIARIGVDMPGVPVRVLALGDLAYPSGDAASVACFDAAWGRFKDRILPVPGNHDYVTDKAKAYFDYFRPTLTALKADRALGTYALDFPAGSRSWRLIALNSNTATGGSERQVIWLRRELRAARTKGRCVLAYAHDFYYSSGRHGHDDGTGRPQYDTVDVSKPLLPARPMRPLFATLAAHRASVFLAGHDHHFEQLGRADATARPADHGRAAMKPIGVRSFVVGTGGKNLYDDDYRQKWAFTEAYDLNRHGILRIELWPTWYRWQFIAVGDAPPSLKVVRTVDTDMCNLTP